MTLSKPNSWTDHFLSADTVFRMLVLFVAAAYLQVITFGLVYDDFSLVTLNTWLHSFAGLKAVFTHHSFAFGDDYAPARHYRPVFLVWMWFVSNGFGSAPGWFHLWALFTHLAACLLAYRLALKLLDGDKMSAAVVALLFAVHPAKAETLGWIAACTEQLSAVFFFGSLLCYLRARAPSAHKGAWIVAAQLCVIGGALTKETAVLIPFVAICYEYLIGRTQPEPIPNRRVLVLIGSLIAALIPVVLLRTAVLGGAGDNAVQSVRPMILTAPLAFWLLARQLVWPIHLSPIYPVAVVTSFSWIYFFFPAMAFLGLVAFFWKGLRPSPLMKFAGVWFVLLLLPVIVEFRWVQLHDRHLYLPSFGAVILLVALLRRSQVDLRLSRVPLAFLILLAVAMSVLSASEVRIWGSSEDVFSRAVEVAPRNPEAVGQLAETYFTTGQHEKAFAVLKQGINVIPYSARLSFSLGDYYYEDGRYQEAQPYLEKVRSLPPDLASAVSGAEYDLGMIEWKRGNIEAAEYHLRAAVAAAPEVVGYRRTLERLTFSRRTPDATPR